MEAGLRLQWIVQVYVETTTVQALAVEGAAVTAGARRKERLDELIERMPQDGGKHNPRRGGKWSRNVRIHLRRPSRGIPKDLPLSGCGVLTGVAQGRETHEEPAVGPLLPPSGGPTQVGTTPCLIFCVRLDSGGVATVRLTA
jgi:hypothetical protein